MKLRKKEEIEIVKPINQLNLFGYKLFFESFVKLFNKKKLPNSILLKGPKGIGKSTFVYHFVNYILSENEENKYSLNEFKINPENSSYKLLSNNTHPNFFLLDKNPLDTEIKIENVRNLIRFLNKTSYKKNLKIVLIDNAEFLNQSSLNALLKQIEEPTNNTFFFIIQNSTFKISATLKSRCSEFKVFFSINEKKDILTKISSQYDRVLNLENVDANFYLDTPGNILNFFLNFNDKENKEFKKNKLSTIFSLIEKYKKNKNYQTLNSLHFFIELFYNEICKYNRNNMNLYYLNYINILKKINEMKKFNLDEKNILLFISDTLKNEKK